MAHPKQSFKYETANPSKCNQSELYIPVSNIFYTYILYNQNLWYVNKPIFSHPLKNKAQNWVCRLCRQDYVLPNPFGFSFQKIKSNQFLLVCIVDLQGQSHFQTNSNVPQPLSLTRCCPESRYLPRFSPGRWVPAKQRSRAKTKSTKTTKVLRKRPKHLENQWFPSVKVNYRFDS